MRFLGIGDTCDLGALYMRLIADGHEVKVHVADSLAQGTMAGLVPHTCNWTAELGWVKQVGSDGIVLFENVAEGRGTLQDELRADGYHVIGGSAWGDRLENDRAYAQQVLADIGLQTCATQEFDDARAAQAFIESRPARYVLKFNGTNFGSADNYVGQTQDGRDVAAMLRAKATAITDRKAGFILMDYAQGIEMGVGAYFDGLRFIGSPCLDWEHKRFFPHDLGELTGEMGTIATFDRSARFFERTLGRMAPLLRDNGYCGYININTIVNDFGIWPLEFTCRFGYPGFAVLDPLQETSWADLFHALVNRSGTVRMRKGFSAGLVMATRPFPYHRKSVPDPVGLPVLLPDDLSNADRAHLHYGELGLGDHGELVTSGCYGWTMVVTGTDATIAGARDKAVALARRVTIPNVRYRCDIGDKLIAGQYGALERLELLDPL